MNPNPLMMISRSFYSALLGVLFLSATNAGADILDRADLSNFRPNVLSRSDRADDDSRRKKKGKKKKARHVKVAKSLNAVKWRREKPNKRAEYYIYLQSASWCPPCRAEMSEIAAQYEQMRADGRVELLLISSDKSVDDAENFLDEYSASFPMTLKTEDGIDELTGLTLASGIPHAIIVTAEGDVIKEGHGSIVKNWREYTIEPKTTGCATSCSSGGTSSGSGCSAVVGPNGAIHVSACGGVKTTH